MPEKWKLYATTYKGGIEVDAEYMRKLSDIELFHVYVEAKKIVSRLRIEIDKRTK